MSDIAVPRLSLVIPTLGKPNGLFRLLDTVVYGAPTSLLSVTELVVFLNQDPVLSIDGDAIEQQLERLRGRFHSLKFIRSSKYYLTAEESACAACEFATGEYLWVAGDKRIFLPEGLAQLANFMESPPTPCAYFNSFWQARDGHTNVHPSTHLTATVTSLSYKQFVQGNGLNFMATNMGVWVFERRFLDRCVWNEIIRECGAHFSHVVTLLRTMGDTAVTCYAVFLAILEAKAYHEGDASEWANYAKRANVHRYFIWTLGLVRDFQHLIDHGAYTYIDVRRSMCSEGGLLNRQIDEIYNHFILQIWQGWLYPAERFTAAEIDEILTFLSRVSPDRTIIHGMLERLCAMPSGLKGRDFIILMNQIRRAVTLDHRELRFSSLVVGQAGNMYLRLHPRGYLLSKVTDNPEFIAAYKVTDPPDQHRHWKIIPDSEFILLDYVPKLLTTGSLFPATVGRVVPRTTRMRLKVRSIALRTYYASGASRVLLKLPPQIMAPIWQRLF